PARPIPSPRPGEASRLAPLDPGHLAATLTAVEVSTLTGEALPQMKSPGGAEGLRRHVGRRRCVLVGVDAARAVSAPTMERPTAQSIKSNWCGARGR
ncbi:hypothetical protein, partial [Micromonospora sp. RV43]|uniref:hypothetical protein n=1 Tax=Micromonospora sp. RV43 TaxID=1661387 RepID=UPI001F3285BD